MSTLVVYLCESDKKTILYRIVDRERINPNMSQIERSISLIEDYQDASDSDLETDPEDIEFASAATTSPRVSYIYDIRELVDTSAANADFSSTSAAAAIASDTPATIAPDVPHGAGIVFNIYGKTVGRIFKIKFVYTPAHSSILDLYKKLLQLEVELKEIYLDICLKQARFAQYIDGCYNKLQSKIYVNDYLIGILQSAYPTAPNIPDRDTVLYDADLNCSEINKVLYIIGDIIKITKEPYVFLDHAKNLSVSRIRDLVVDFLIDNISPIPPGFNSRSIVFRANCEPATYNTCEYMIDIGNIHHSLYYVLYTYLIVYHKNNLRMSIDMIDIYLHEDSNINVTISFKDVIYDGYVCSEADFVRFVASIRNSVAEPEILYILVNYLKGTISADVGRVSISYPVVNLQNASQSAARLKPISEYFKLNTTESPPIDSSRKRACILLIGFNKSVDAIFNEKLNTQNYSCKYIQITDVKDYWRAVNNIKRQLRKYKKYTRKYAKENSDIGGTNSAPDSDDSFIKKYSINTAEAVNKVIGRISSKFNRRSPSKLWKLHKVTNLASSKSENDKSADDLADQLDTFSLTPSLSPPMRKLNKDTTGAGDSTHSSPVAKRSSISAELRRDSHAYSSGSITYDDMIDDNTDYISTSDERTDETNAASVSEAKSLATITTMFKRGKDSPLRSIHARSANVRRNRGISKKYNTSLVSYIRRLKIKCFMIIIIGDPNDVNKAQFITELITIASSRMSGPIGLTHSMAKFMYVDTRNNLELIKSRKIKLPHPTIAPTFDMINHFGNINDYLAHEYSKVSKPLGNKRVLIVHQNSITGTYLYLLLTAKGFADVTVFDHNVVSNEGTFESMICSYNIFYIDYYINYFHRMLEILNNQEIYKIIVIANSITYDKKIELYNSGVNRILKEPIRYTDILSAASDVI